MALSEKSTLVTAPSSASVAKYELKINSKVNDNELVVNDKADELETKIQTCYTNLNKYFKAIADEYKKCASQSVKGDKLVSSLKKVAKNCEEQGKYCLNRKQQLDTLYKKAKSEQYTRDLENTISEMQGQISTLTERVNALEGNSGDKGPKIDLNPIVDPSDPNNIIYY